MQIETADSYKGQELVEQLDKLGEGRTKQISDALVRLFPFKVVIIGYLSC